MPTVGIGPAWRQDVERGLNPAKPIASFDVAALMRLLDEKVRASISHLSVNPLMDFIYSSMTEGGEYIAHVPIACAKGCSFCCRAWVDTTPPEILYTVKNMPYEQRLRAVEAVERACSITAGATFLDRCGKVNPPCPMLDDMGACSVYETRPIACRTLVSTNVEKCKKTFVDGDASGFPGLKVWLVLRDSYANALEGALIHSGLAYRAREWNESLRIALAKPDAEEQWLSGTDVFAGAPVSPALSAFENPMWRGIYQQAFGAPPP